MTTTSLGPRTCSMGPMQVSAMGQICPAEAFLPWPSTCKKCKGGCGRRSRLKLWIFWQGIGGGGVQWRSFRPWLTALTSFSTQANQHFREAIESLPLEGGTLVGRPGKGHSAEVEKLLDMQKVLLGPSPTFPGLSQMRPWRATTSLLRSAFLYQIARSPLGFGRCDSSSKTTTTILKNYEMRSKKPDIWTIWMTAHDPSPEICLRLSEGSWLATPGETLT